MPTDLELMELAISARFQQDDQERLLTVNEPGDRPAPRLFLGRTLAGDLARFRHDLSPAHLAALRHLLADEPPATDLRQLPASTDAIRDTLERDGQPTSVWHGPAWHVSGDLPVAGDAVRITPEHLELARDTFPWLLTELPWRQPCFAVVRQGAAVSVCFSSRNTTLAAEAGVETIPEQRGRGYAPLAVAAWAAEVRRQCRVPLYSTSWDNTASQAVARRLGLMLFGATLSFT